MHQNPHAYPSDPGHEAPMMQRNNKEWTEAKEQRRKIQRLKHYLFAYNLTIFFFGMVVLGVGIWMAVERSFMTYIIGSDLYSVTIYMILIGGGFVFFVSFLGCCGAITENRCMVMTFAAVLLFFGLVLFIGGFIGIGFSAQIGSAVQGTMEETLKKYYGVDFHNLWNRQVTEAWDRAQERLHCCAVRTEGWNLYKETKWYELYGATDDTETGTKYGHEDLKPYVPQSCCVKDRFWRYVNLDVCQLWRLGPPGSPDEGAINRALYYEGCYDRGLRYMKENSAVMISLGLVLCALLALGIVLSIFLLKNQDKYEEHFGHLKR
jgi:hypothetical protein